jgi:outer membrane lipopolysaccharide assembly protein LptE/RlpB
MTNEELEAQFSSVMPPAFTAEQRSKTYQVFREINGHSYEQIAVLMEMQRQMVVELMRQIESTEKEKRQNAATKLVKASRMPTRRGFLNGE